MASTNPESSGHKTSEGRFLIGFAGAITLLTRFRDELGFDWIDPAVLWPVAIPLTAYILKRGYVKAQLIKAGRFNGGE